MAMFGFGKTSKHEEGAKASEGKAAKRDDAKGAAKRLFGVPLESVALVEAKCFDNDVLLVPVVVRDSIEWLRTHKGLTEEGIFRVPGNQAEIDALKKQYDTTGTAQLESYFEAHTLAGLLKLWFRELPEPVLIFRYYETFIRVGKNPDPTTRKKNLCMLLTGLPEVNRSLILYLMEFLKDVAANSEKNKMGTDNVAMVFAPNILRPQQQQDQNALLNDAGAVKDILRLLIEELAFMRAAVMRSRKNLTGDTANPTMSGLISPRGTEPSVLSPREEALMLSESTKLKTAVIKEDPGKAGKPGAPEPDKKAEPKRGHKHSRSIGHLIPFVHKSDAEEEERAGEKEPARSPKEAAAKKEPLSGKHLRTESARTAASQEKRGEGPRFAPPKDAPSAAPASGGISGAPASAPVRRSQSAQDLDDLRSLAQGIDMAALQSMDGKDSAEQPPPQPEGAAP